MELVDDLQQDTLQPQANDVGIRPISARLVVQLQAVQEATRDSGLVLPSGDSVDTYKADVVAVGVHVEHVHLGDLVLLSIGAIMGSTFMYRQESFAIVNERDVLAVLDRE